MPARVGVWVIVGVWIVVVDPRGMAVGMAVDERAVAVLVGVHVRFVGVGVANRWRHETSVLTMPTAAQVRTIGMMPTR
jgi:hypothetical protein